MIRALRYPVRHIGSELRSLLLSLAETVLRGWHAISPAFGVHCRFAPTCSMYAAEALRRHGILRGGALSVRRLCRCNSLCAGGHDPVPEVNRIF